MERVSITTLLIEDNPGDAVLIRELLRDSEDITFQVLHADTLSSGLDLLKQEEVDVILLDLALPDSQGLDTFLTIQSHHAHMPVVILTGLDDKDVAVNTMHQGAQEYLVKGQVDTDLLTRSIRYAIERKSAQEELRKSEINYRNIITNNADAMMIINNNGIIQYVNPAAEDLFGQGQRNMVGCTFEYPLNLQESREIEILRPDNTHAKAGMKTVETIWEGKQVFLAVLRDITENVIAQQALEKQTQNLMERIKELQCIYRIGELTRREDIPIETALKEIVRLIPRGWQKPARTGCRIIFGENIFTENFTETQWMQRADIKDSEKVGTIEVSYCGIDTDKAESEFDPFLVEEQELLNAVADRIGEFMERVRAKEILKESEKKYRTLFDNSSDAIFIHTLEGNFLEINQVAIDRLGYSKEELVTSTLHEINSPPRATMISEQIEMVVRDGHLLFETVHIAKDGHIIPTEISSRLIEFDGKKAILSVARDISDRKQAEKQLQTSYLFLEVSNRHTYMSSLLIDFLEIIKDLTECEAVGIRIIDDVGIILHQAQIGFPQNFIEQEKILCKTSFKWANSHVSGKYCNEDALFFTDDGSFFINNAGKDVTPELWGEIDLYEICVQTGYQSMAFIPIRAEDRTSGIIHIADSRKNKFTLEIIEALEKAAMQLGIAIQRIIITEKLHESEKTARGLLNSMTEAAFLMGLDGTIIAANDEFCRRLNIPKEHVVGTCSYDLIPPEIVFTRKSMVERVISTKEPVLFEDIRNGRHILNSIYPFFGDRGAVEKLSIFGYDITDQKKAEEKIRASLREKEALLKEIHHRVKNNMQIICSLLNLQSRHIHDEDMVNILRESQNRIKSMALVHEKLYRSEDFSKINFNIYVKTLIREIIHSYGERATKITVDLNIGRLFLGIDTAIPCGLIINELLSNAFNHAFQDRRKGRVCISLHARTDGQYELDISDNGIGIPPHITPDTTESLGLRLVHILAKDQLRGTLELERTNGTAYRILFGDDQ